MSDYLYAKTCITLNRGTTIPVNSIEWENTYNPTFANEEPIHIPFKVQVIAPNATQELVGDIYDRYYEVQSKIRYKCKEMPDVSSSVYENTKFWMDKASTIKSIRSIITKDDWEGLVYDTSISPKTENTIIPETMREKVKELVERQIRVDDNYFEVILNQLKSFLDNILRELTYEFDDDNEKQAIVDICKFKYNVSGVVFPTFDGQQWNIPSLYDSQPPTCKGLFGYGRSSTGGWSKQTIKKDYESCRLALNNHMWSDFCLDFGQLDIPAAKDKIGDYSWILDGRGGNNIWGYYKSSYSRIYEKRNNTLNELHDLIDTPISDDDIICKIFQGNNDILVRYINAIKTDVVGQFKAMFIADNYCHLFMDSDNKRSWYKLDAIDNHVKLLLEYKRLDENYEYSPKLQIPDYGIDSDGSWIFKMLNRNLGGATAIEDSYALQCVDGEKELWYVP